MTESELKHYTHNYAHTIECQSDVHEWIDSRVKDQPTSEVEHIIDYLASDRRPRRLDRATYSQMKHNADKWSYSLQKKGKDIDDTDGVETILDFGDGFRFVKLISKEAYDSDEEHLNNTVDIYYPRPCEVVSLRGNDGVPIYNFAIQKFDTERIEYIQGKRIGGIHHRHIDYVLDFMDARGIEVESDVMESFGYEKVYFPKLVAYVEGDIHRGYRRKGSVIRYRDDVAVFYDADEAVSYTGDKTVVMMGFIYFTDNKCNAETPGQIEYVSSNVFIIGDSLKDMGRLKHISGSLFMENSGIKTLGELHTIERTLAVQDSKLEDLGNLRYVRSRGGDDLIDPDCNLDFKNVQVGGKPNTYNEE